AIGITLFLQIVFPKIMPIGIIILSLSVIYLGFSKEVKFVATKTHFYLIAFYATYLIGVFFTNNPNEASHVLESKLSFLIFPLLFFIIPKKKINLLLPISLSNLGLMIAF